MITEFITKLEDLHLHALNWDSVISYLVSFSSNEVNNWVFVVFVQMDRTNDTVWHVVMETGDGRSLPPYPSLPTYHYHASNHLFAN